MASDSTGAEKVVTESGQLEVPKRASSKLAHKIFMVLSAVALLIAMMITVANVTGRALFNTPVWGSVEMIGLSGVVLIPFAICYMDLIKGHITVDILVSRLSRRTRKYFAMGAYILSLAVVGLLIYGAYQEVIYTSVTPGSYTPDLYVPLLPFKTLWFIQAILLFGCVVWNLIETTRRRPE